jgi:hypothetical protein
MRSPFPCGALLGLAAVLSCRSERSTPVADATPPAPTTPNTVTFTATDFAFTGPTQIAAGQTILHLANKGKEPHHMVVIRVEQGRTYDSLLAALRKPGPPPGWVRVLGGPIAGEPGRESSSEHLLTPGQYAVVCFVPSTDGAPHFTKGMVSALEVTPGTSAPAAESEADIAVKLNDYDFEFETALTPGRHMIKVENTAPQMHEIVIAKLNPGKSAKQLIDWEFGGRKGEAPGTYLTGMAPMQQGEAARFEVNLDPGEYALICFVPDAKDGKPHTMHGMLKQIKVG